MLDLRRGEYGRCSREVAFCGGVGSGLRSTKIQRGGQHGAASDHETLKLVSPGSVPPMGSEFKSFAKILRPRDLEILFPWVASHLWVRNSRVLKKYADHGTLKFFSQGSVPPYGFATQEFFKNTETARPLNSFPLRGRLPPWVRKWVRNWALPHDETGGMPPQLFLIPMSRGGFAYRRHPLRDPSHAYPPHARGPRRSPGHPGCAWGCQGCPGRSAARYPGRSASQWLLIGRSDSKHYWLFVAPPDQDPHAQPHHQARTESQVASALAKPLSGWGEIATNKKGGSPIV